jgi:hypothetical protein
MVGTWKEEGKTAVNSIDVTCQCGRELSIDVSGWPELIEIPTLRKRLKCMDCARRPIDVRPDWTQHRASGNGRL